MGPYSHAVLAAQLLPHLHPAEPADYLWGAVAPDIRYLAKLPRAQTHVSLETVKDWAARYPHLASFILGYRVHLLIDRIDVVEVVGRAFPLNLLQLARRKRFGHKQITMLIDLYYLQHRTPPPLMGRQNALLDELGISPDITARYADSMRAYFDGRSYQAAIATFEKNGMLGDASVQTLIRIFEDLERKKGVKTLLFLGVRNAHLDQVVKYQVLPERHTG